MSLPPRSNVRIHGHERVLTQTGVAVNQAQPEEEERVLDVDGSVWSPRSTGGRTSTDADGGVNFRRN